MEHTRFIDSCRRLRAILRRVALPAMLAGMSASATADGLATSAEYIVGFVRYVHWDNEDGIDAWRICILGHIAPAEDRAYVDKTVRGKAFVVRRLELSQSLDGCHVVDLTAADAATVGEVLLRARHLPILSVGSESAFCQAGGLICLRLRGGEPKFEVNLSSLADSGLKVSARLLMLGAGRGGIGGKP